MTAGPDSEPAAAPPTTVATAPPPPTARSGVLLALFVLATLFAIGGGILYYRSEAAEVYDDAARQLEVISQLKHRQLESWRMERLGDATVLQSRNAQTRSLIDLLSGVGDSSEEVSAREWLGTYVSAYRQYDRAFLIAQNGAVRLSVPNAREAPATALLDAAARATRTGDVALLDFYLDERDGQPHLAIVTPVIDRVAGSAVVGAMVLRIDPASELYAVLAIEQGNSRTGETELVRREGQDVLFLNPLRFDRGSALTLRAAIADANRLASRAANGEIGLVRGIDYRSAEVLGFVTPVSHSPWILVTRIDVAELDAALYSHLWLVTTGVILLIVSAGTTLGLVRRDQRMRAVARQAELVVELEDRDERLRLAMASAKQGMWDLSLDTGVTRTSPEYAAMLGYAPNDFEETAEAWNARVHPDDFGQCQTVFHDYIEGRRADYVVEFRQRTSNGSWIWIHSTGRIVERASDGHPTRMLGIHTDISPRKEAELAAARLSTLYLTLSRCNEAIVRSTSPAELFDEICRAIVESGGFAMASVSVVEQNSAQLRPTAAYGAHLDYLEGLVLTVGADGEAWQGPFADAIRSRAAVWLDDVAEAAIDSPLMDRVRRAGWAGMAAVPLLKGGEAIGALGIYANARGRFDSEARRLLTEMAANISFALDAFARDAQRQDAEAQLRQSEQRYRALFSESSVPMLVIDPAQSRVVDANEAAASLYGWPVAELRGQPFERIATPAPAGVGAGFDQPLTAQGHFTTQHRTATGELRDVEVFSAVITVDHDQRLVATVTDITARLEAERQAARLSRMYRTLSRCNEAIARCESADELFPQICEAAVDAGGFGLAWIGLVNPASLDVERVAAHGVGLPYVDDLRISADPDSPYSSGVTGSAIREKRLVVIENLETDPRSAVWHERIRAYSWVSAVAIPLLREGEAVGALTIYSTTSGAFDADIRTLLAEMAADLSFALDVLARDARRQKAEQRLRQSEARYRTLFAESGVPMLLVDNLTGQITDANAAAAEFYGFDLPALRRMHIGDLNTLPADQVHERLSALRASPKMRVNSQHRLASGELRHVEVFAASLTVDDRPRILAIVSDVTLRKQAEAALIEKEFQLTEAQRLAHIGNWTRQPDGTGSWSDEVFSLYGLAPDAAAPTLEELHERLRPEDKALVSRAQKGHLLGEPVASIEFRVLLPDGSVRYLLERGEQRVAPDGHSYAAGTLQDVTERKAAEQAVQGSEERLRLALGAARQGLWDLELPTQTAVLSVPNLASPGFADDVVTVTFQQFLGWLHPADRARVEEAFRAYARADASSFEEEFRVILQDGQVRWVHSTGGIVQRDRAGSALRVVGVVTDITEQHAIVEALRLRDRAMESSQNAIAIGDLDGVLTYVNQAFLDIWELSSKDDALGRNAVAFGENPDDVTAIVRDMHATQAPWMGELRAVTATGRRRDVLTSAAFVTDEQNRPIGLVAAFVDITDRKLTELAMAASLREKEALLKEVHHRVKNNLQVISSLLRLELGRSSEPGVKLVLGEMQNRILSMALLHETLYRSDDLAGVDLSTYLNRLVQQLFRSAAPPLGRVELRLAVEHASVDLEQAVPCGLLVTELMSNALKHAFPDTRSGEVRVELSRLDDGRSLRIVVSDTGIGLPADFDARRAQSLGLQLVSDLVRQLRGTLDVGPGPGASFTLTFTPREASPLKAPGRGIDQ